MSLPGVLPTAAFFLDRTYSSCSSLRSSVSRYGISSVTMSGGGAAAAIMLARRGRKSCPHSWQKFSLQSLTVAQLGQVRVFGRAVAVVAVVAVSVAGMGSATGAVEAAVEGATAGAGDTVGDGGVGAVVGVVVATLGASPEATGVDGGAGTTGPVAVARVDRRVRIITKASASNTTTTTTRSTGSHGKLLLLEAGEVLVVAGLLPVAGLFAGVGMPALAVSW